MKILRAIFGLSVVFLLASLAACFDFSSARQRDERTLREQLHIPQQVELALMASYPPPGSWFGREGLFISAVFKFTPQQFESYVSSLNDSSLWQPVPFPYYVPDRASDYSEDAFKWSDTAPPNVPIINQGKYYCWGMISKTEKRQVKTAEGDMADLPNVNRIVGRACSELNRKDRLYVRVVAGLDFKTQELRVEMKFTS